MKTLLLGYDIGSSSVKANLTDADSGKTIASAAVPETEMEIISRKTGWAEQDPAVWWSNLAEATGKVMQSAGVKSSSIAAIGISYQMHGLVAVDKQQRVLRPAIIWCDSRAVEIGEKSFGELGPDYCFRHLLNSPGNFTASKLKWVLDHEPEIASRIYKVMLPGDFIAMKMTGEISTTAPGFPKGSCTTTSRPGRRRNSYITSVLIGDLSPISCLHSAYRGNSPPRRHKNLVLHRAHRFVTARAISQTTRTRSRLFIREKWRPPQEPPELSTP